MSNQITIIGVKVQFDLNTFWTPSYERQWLYSEKKKIFLWQFWRKWKI